MKKAQLELNKFKIENKELKLLVAEQTSHGGSSRPTKKSKGSKSKKRRGSDSESEGDIWLDRVALLGRKFGVMNEIFVEPKHFMVVRPDMDPYDTTNRYASPQSRMVGLTAELFREIPEDLHELLVNDSKFRDEVLRKYTFLKVLLTSMAHGTVHYQAERQSPPNCASTPLHFCSKYLWRQ